MWSTYQALRYQGNDSYCFYLVTSSSSTLRHNHVTAHCLYRHLPTKLAQFIRSDHLMQTRLIHISFFRSSSQKIHIEKGTRLQILIVLILIVRAFALRPTASCLLLPCFQLGVEHSKDVTEFAIMYVLPELDGILASKEEQQTTLKAFLGRTNAFHYKFCQTIRCLLWCTSHQLKVSHCY